MLRNMSIRMKLLGGFLLVVVLLAIAAGVGLTGIGQIDSKVEAIGHTNWPAADALMEMRVSFLEKAFAH